MSYGVNCRQGSDSELLWLWHRLAAAGPIRSLAWEPPYAMGIVLKSKKNKKQKKKNKTKSLQTINAGEVVEKREPSYTVDANINWYNHYGKLFGGASEN